MASINTPINTQYQKLKASFFYISIIGLICIVIWIATSVFYAINKPTVDPTINQLIKPLQPNLDAQSVFDFQQSRQPAPDQFQILVVDNQNNQAQITSINPFTNQTTVEAEQPTEPNNQTIQINPESAIDIPIDNQSTPAASLILE
jgi:hypothetical protein